ncbi:MAG TPA: DUF1318 domain-containing protein [Oceanospirillales bacterium]|nr:hypothetical protein [Oceanospirillaceae bacterium]HBS43164.1 DUF1318 domain-containing protein [Oceanospirillales bacterium]|tara:strand:- start:1975 stop:2295 length:321 start_codon:yes stop_codon:yes gene_type:complete
MRLLPLLFAALLFSLPAAALELDEAKDLGLVGEMPNGYLGLVATSNPEAAALIAEINVKRKSHYQGIANEQNTALENIEKIAGEKLVKKAQAEGHYYMNVSAQWQN